MKNRRSLILLGALGLILHCTPSAFADGIMFMDEAGNIHFANSVSQVPLQYRPQVVKPRIIDGTSKDFKKDQARKKKAAARLKKVAAKQKIKDEKVKARKMRKKKKELERAQKKMRRVTGGGDLEEI